ncbi:MAG: hypothetical protein HY961_04735, partial [Ignavibacteriae bacterium]|nr:hypothetical protein [Ignavibacteriota bacterium]
MKRNGIDVRQRYAQEIEAEARMFYRKALDLLNANDIAFLVGGAYALQRYAGIVRSTKDFDIFVKPEDCERALNLFAPRGYRTEIPFPHWLGKIYDGEYVVDVIFGSGNGTTSIDEDWFRYAVDDVVLETTIKLVPPEEMIYSKAYVMERERYDGADVNHIIRATGEKMDWRRLLMRFGSDWKVLLNHLVLFDFVYPSE